MDLSYSPYNKEPHRKPSKFKMPNVRLPKGVKKWITIIVGIFVFILFISYLMLGELRFFVNHFLGLGFFSKHYLVLLQNNYELRPTGGFITGYGNLDLVMGFPKKLTFKNSYAIDTAAYVTPPYPHEEMLKNEWYQGYTFRDANWNPDFPSAATELVDFYQKKFPDSDVDGLAVVNFSLIEDLVDALGGIELNGKLLTKQNLFSELEFAVNNVDRHDIDALDSRKNVLGELAGALFKKAKWHPFVMKKVLIDSLSNKNFFLWLGKKGLEEALIERGWANTLVPADRSDFLAVNLANLGAKKSDRYVRAETHYQANLTGEVPAITTEVVIRYPGTINTYSDNYKGYLRLYIPKNATMESAPVDSHEGVEGGFRVIGTQLVLPAGGKTSLLYSYTLPRNTFLEDEYRLRLIKQSGIDMLYDLNVQAPDGRFVESGDFEVLENRARFMDWPKHDLDLALRILPDTLPPYPIEQEFEDLNHITVIWNEAMDEKSATDPTHYVVADTNEKDEKSDKVKVVSVETLSSSIFRLQIEGATRQELERYRIDLNGLKDKAGNPVSPDPLSITAVQRFRSAPSAAPSTAPPPTPAPSETPAADQ